MRTTRLWGVAFRGKLVITFLLFKFVKDKDKLLNCTILELCTHSNKLISIFFNIFCFNNKMIILSYPITPHTPIQNLHTALYPHFGSIVDILPKPTLHKHN